MLLNPSNDHIPLDSFLEILTRNIVEWAGSKYVRRKFLEELGAKHPLPQAVIGWSEG